MENNMQTIQFFFIGPEPFWLNTRKNAQMYLADSEIVFNGLLVSLIPFDMNHA